MPISNFTATRASASVFLMLVLSGVLAVATAAAAQTRGWLWQNPLPQGNAIHALRFAADKLSVLREAAEMMS
jgi:hypothetical protein